MKVINKVHTLDVTLSNSFSSARVIKIYFDYYTNEGNNSFLIYKDEFTLKQGNWGVNLIVDEVEYSDDEGRVMISVTAGLNREEEYIKVNIPKGEKLYIRGTELPISTIKDPDIDNKVGCDEMWGEEFEI